MEARHRVVQCQGPSKAKQGGRPMRLRNTPASSAWDQGSGQGASGHGVMDYSRRDDDEKIYQAGLEFGHHASVRREPTAEGFTHDWVVFVRGAGGASGIAIEHFVERIEFHLHESFPKPKRVVKEAPFLVREAGYGGFTFPIDVYLRNATGTKKFRVLYHLFLPAVGELSHCLCELVSFRNPSEQFLARLKRGGAKEILGDENGLVTLSDETNMASKPTPVPSYPAPPQLSPASPSQSRHPLPPPQLAAPRHFLTPAPASHPNPLHLAHPPHQYTARQLPASIKQIPVGPVKQENYFPAPRETRAIPSYPGDGRAGETIGEYRQPVRSGILNKNYEFFNGAIRRVEEQRDVLEKRDVIREREGEESREDEWVVGSLRKRKKTHKSLDAKRPRTDEHQLHPESSVRHTAGAFCAEDASPFPSVAPPTTLAPPPIVSQPPPLAQPASSGPGRLTVRICSPEIARCLQEEIQRQQQAVNSLNTSPPALSHGSNYTIPPPYDALPDHAPCFLTENALRKFHVPFSASQTSVPSSIFAVLKNELRWKKPVALTGLVASTVKAVASSIGGVTSSASPLTSAAVVARRKPGRPRKESCVVERQAYTGEKRRPGRPPKAAADKLKPVVVVSKLTSSGVSREGVTKASCKPAKQNCRAAVAIEDRWRRQSTIIEIHASFEGEETRRNDVCSSPIETSVPVQATCTEKPAEACSRTFSVISCTTEVREKDNENQVTNPVEKTLLETLVSEPKSEKVLRNLFDAIPSVSRPPEKSAAIEKAPEVALKSEADWSDEIEVRQRFDVDLNFNYVDVNVERNPLLTSTPIRCAAAPVVKKSGPRVRFRPYVEEFSACDDPDVSLSPKDVLARYAKESLPPVSASTVPSNTNTVRIDEILSQEEKKMIVVARSSQMSTDVIDELKRRREERLGGEAAARSAQKQRKVVSIADELLRRKEHLELTSSSNTERTAFRHPKLTVEKNSIVSAGSPTTIALAPIWTSTPVEKAKPAKPFVTKAAKKQISGQTAYDDAEDCSDKENKPNKTLLSSVKNSFSSDAQKEAVSKHSLNSSRAYNDAAKKDENRRAPNGERMSVLNELASKLSTLTDLKLMQRIVEIIEETGKYQLNDITFDFDLCYLDLATVKKLRQCLFGAAPGGAQAS